jgi:hypothetical protein
VVWEPGGVTLPATRLSREVLIIDLKNLASTNLPDLIIERELCAHLNQRVNIIWTRKPNWNPCCRAGGQAPNTAQIQEHLETLIATNSANKNIWWGWFLPATGIGWKQPNFSKDVWSKLHYERLGLTMKSTDERHSPVPEF